MNNMHDAHAKMNEMATKAEEHKANIRRLGPKPHFWEEDENQGRGKVVRQAPDKDSAASWQVATVIVIGLAALAALLYMMICFK